MNYEELGRLIAESAGKAEEAGFLFGMGIIVVEPTSAILEGQTCKPDGKFMFVSKSFWNREIAPQIQRWLQVPLNILPPQGSQDWQHHTLSADCWCGPDVQTDVAGNQVIIHRRLT